MVRVNILMFNHTRDASLPRALKKISDKLNTRVKFIVLTIT